MIASKSNPVQWKVAKDPGEGHGWMVWSMLKERGGFGTVVQLNMQIELHLCLGSQKLLGERLPQGCKHRTPYPLEPVGSGTLKCSLTRYALSNVCSIESYPLNHRFPPLASSCNFRLIDPLPISQILHLFFEVVNKN